MTKPNNLCGSGLSNMFLKVSRWFLKSTANDWNASSDSSVRMSPQARSEIQSGLGFSTFLGLFVPPARKNRYSSLNPYLYDVTRFSLLFEINDFKTIDMLFLFINIRTVSKNAKRSLCFSNKLRHTLV